MDDKPLRPAQNPLRKVKLRTPARQYERTTAFKLEPAFCDALIERLEEVRNGENYQLRGVFSSWPQFSKREVFGAETIPDRKQLETLIEQGFWASLQREESRLLKFNVYYAKSSGATQDVKFLDSKPYDVATLTKLAPAVSNQIFGIGVYSSEKGELRVWGLTTSSGLRIVVIDPGKLIVKFLFTTVAAVSGDQTLLIRRPTLPFGGSLFWDRVFTASDDYPSWLNPKIRVIQIILSLMREFHHGGTLVIIPQGSQVGLHGPFGCEVPSLALADTLKELDVTSLGSGSKAVEIRTLEDYRDNIARAVAALTCIDGATILTPDLEILGFGVKFEFNSESSSQILVLESDSMNEKGLKQVSLNEIGGMRHQSAAQFVKAHHDAIAFVASQDGNVTAFVWEEWGDQKQHSSLVAYTRLELTMF
ncbi:MAG TPA: hypothetical protein VLB46_21385 [Pyrinomonadaceae bacterium]|nr:hypothetical protein [Pyrinomonadaceae bacterium]